MSDSREAFTTSASTAAFAGAGSNLAKRPRSIVIASVGATVLVTITALVSWLCGNATLVSLLPGQPGMSSLTAVSFLFCASALAALGLSRD